MENNLDKGFPFLLKHFRFNVCPVSFFPLAHPHTNTHRKEREGGGKKNSNMDKYTHKYKHNALTNAGKKMATNQNPTKKDFEGEKTEL